MDAPVENVQDSSIFSNDYEKEVYLDNMKFGIRKAVRALLVVGGIFLLGDLISLATLPEVESIVYLIILVIPAIYGGLALLARKKTMLAMILGAVVWVGIILLSMIATDATAIFSGWLMKAAMIYFLINGFNGAKEAEEARKNLELFK